MNLSIFEDIIRSEISFHSVLDTFKLLVEYFKRNGQNMFRAPESAENNVSNFIKEIQDNINEYHRNNIICLYRKVDRSITMVEPDYFVVLEIRDQLLKLPWQDFEDFCGVLIRKCFNAQDVKITQRTADWGVDFEGKVPFNAKHNTLPFAFIELYGQAKRYTNNVCRGDVDSFTAFANRRKRDNQYPAQLFLFCTTSDFVSSAKDEIKKNFFVGLNGMQIASLVFNEIKDKIVDDNFIDQFVKY